MAGERFRRERKGPLVAGGQLWSGNWMAQIPLRLELAARNWETMDSILSN